MKHLKSILAALVCMLLIGMLAVGAFAEEENLITADNMNLYATGGNSNLYIEDGWLKTRSDQRFMAKYKETLGTKFALSVEVAPINGFLENFINIHMDPNVPEPYAGMDFHNSYSIFIGEINPGLGSVNIRMAKILPRNPGENGFRGWMPINGGLDALVTTGIMNGMEEGDTLTVHVNVDGDNVQVQLYRTDDPSLRSEVANFDLSAAPCGTSDTDPVPKTGIIGLSNNGWKTGAQYTNLKVYESGQTPDIPDPGPTDPTQPTEPKPTLPADDGSMGENSFTLHSFGNSGKLHISEGWITTSANERFLAEYNTPLGEDFSFSVEIKPVDGYMENFIGIHMSGIANNYDGFDPCTGYGIYIGDIDRNTGRFNIRMNRVVNGFKGWIPPVGTVDDCVTVPGLLKDMEADDTLTLQVVVKGDLVYIQVFRTDNPERKYGVITYDLTTPTLGNNDTTDVPRTGVLTLAHNGWKTGKHYTNLKIGGVEMPGVTDKVESEFKPVQPPVFSDPTGPAPTEPEPTEKPGQTGTPGTTEKDPTSPALWIVLGAAAVAAIAAAVVVFIRKKH